MSILKTQHDVPKNHSQTHNNAGDQQYHDETTDVIEQGVYPRHCQRFMRLLRFS